MNRLIQKSLLAVPVLVLGVSILLSSVVRAAGTATLSLSPSSGSYTVGSIISIDIIENSGSDNVNTAQANLSYNPGLLTFSSISDSSAFNIGAQSTGGGGTVLIGRGVTNSNGNSVSGSQVVATVRFTASAAGSATINFASGSEVDRSSDSTGETLTTTGGTYTITAPATPPPSPTPTPTPSPTPSPKPSPSPSSKPTPSPSPSSSSTPTPSPSPSPTAANPTASPSPSSASDSAAPVAISVSKVTDKTATISWTTAVPTTTELNYGLNAQYGVSVVDSKLTTNHTVVLSSKILIPGSTFHYMVKGVDANGNVIASGDKTFATAKTAAKKSGSTGAIIAAVVVLGLLAAGGGSFFWIKNGGPKPQWAGFEPAVKPEPTSTGAPAGQVVKPAGDTIKPGENVIKPGDPKPPIS